jgi:hypothetical protein
MKKNNNQNGQSTVEFIFTFAFAVTIVFLIFNSALNYSTGYLIHYATFMGSRAFVSSESFTGNYGSSDQAVQAGKATAFEVFDTYELGVFNVQNLQFKVNAPNSGLTPREYLTVGAYTIFDAKIDAIGRITGQKTLEMVSESFLGKEPVRAECASRVCHAITNGQVDDCSFERNPRLDITLFDDGC